MNIKNMNKRLTALILAGVTLVSTPTFVGCKANIQQNSTSISENKDSMDLKIIKEIKNKLLKGKDNKEEIDLLKNNIANFINNDQQIFNTSFYDLNEKTKDEIIRIAKNLGISITKTNKSKITVKKTKVECVKTVENIDGTVTEFYDEIPYEEEIETYTYKAEISNLQKKYINENEVINKIANYFETSKKTNGYKNVCNDLVISFINGDIKLDNVNFYDLSEETKLQIVEIARKNGMLIKPIKYVKKNVEKIGVKFVGTEIKDGQEIELFDPYTYTEEINVCYYMAVSKETLINFINDNKTINNVYFNNLDEKTKDEIIKIAQEQGIEVFKVEIGTKTINGKKVKVYDYLAKGKENIPPKLYTK